MKTASKLALATAAFIAGAGVAHAQVVSIATGRQGSLGFNTGQAVAKVLSLKTKMKVRTQPMAGTTAYLPLINTGELAFGFANALESFYVHSGTGSFKGKPNPNVRVAAQMFPLRTGIAVAADSGIKTVKDLKAKMKGMRIASGYKASTIIPYYIAGALANGGMKYSDFKNVPVSGFVPGILALGDGRVDLTLISVGSAAGRKVNAQLKSRGGFRYVSLDPSPEGQKLFKQSLPAGRIIPMKANKNLPGLIEDTNMIEIPWMMLTSTAVKEELVYQSIKTLVENLPDLKKSFGAFRRQKKEAMAPDVGMPYHPGAVRYFKEAGMMK